MITPNKVRFLICGVALWAAPLAAQDTEWSFRGARLGEPLPTSMVRQFGCTDKPGDIGESSCGGGTFIGETHATIAMRFLDGRLMWFSASYDAKHGDEQREALVALYGPPARTRIDTLQNIYGAIFRSPVYIWSYGRPVLELQTLVTLATLTGIKDGGTWSIADPTLVDERERRRKAKPNAAALDMRRQPR